MTRPVSIVQRISGAQASVVVVAPHPDDESLATGSLIQTAAAGGARVTVVVLTDGENNPWPQRASELRIRITPRDRARWGARRREEARRALDLLGVAEADMHFLGLPDLGLTDRLMLDPTDATSDLRAIFGRVGATVVVAPGLRDTHPDHSAAHIMARTAAATCGPGATVLSYMVHGHQDGAGAECALDSGTVKRKMTAVATHTSQHVLSGRRMQRYANAPERFDLESACVCAPAAVDLELPWRLRRLACSCNELLVVSSKRAWRVAVRSGHSSPGAARPVCIRRDDGALRLHVPEVARAQTPIFAKLVSRIPSPWIYDHWGWTLVDTGSGS